MAEDVCAESDQHLFDYHIKMRAAIFVNQANSPFLLNELWGVHDLLPLCVSSKMECSRIWP